MSWVTNKIKRNRGRLRRPEVKIRRFVQQIPGKGSVIMTERIIPPDVCVVGKQWGEIVTYLCGHRGRRHFIHWLYGEELTGMAQRKKCGPCVLREMKNIIGRCALCAKPILPGDPFGRASNLGDNRPLRVPQSHWICCRRGCCPPWGMIGTWAGGGAIRQPEIKKVKFGNGGVIIAMRG